MNDQAQRLREMVGRLRTQPAARPVRRARVLAVTGGKGGVGKTNLAVNLAIAMHAMGRGVVLLDADLGMSNVDVLLGTTPAYHLGHVLAGERQITDLIYPGPGGLRLVAAGTGMTDLADLARADLQRLVAAMDVLTATADYLLLDTGAGIGRNVLAFTLAADEVLVVSTPEPTALADAYAVIKAVANHNRALTLRLVLNQVEGPEEAERAGARLTQAVLRFVGVPLEGAGCVPHDPAVRRAVRRQVPFVLDAPGCQAARALRQIAAVLVGEPLRGPAPRSLFLERLSRLVSAGR